ncbi:methionine aminopeptidase 1D, mitochondrial-like isoform X1 [Penaeus chinensis]|uniref:methionine aminopeptidase 1D, mitochondrial-like isoform X1 n=1 Tax=Penaeus chinensis TaxID=139456 RepID=UPI001FB81EA2|nr:methionine aminopeptidase 1D, mitochondrial-like isoform X1 [Penaeus chinensis]
MLFRVLQRLSWTTESAFTTCCSPLIIRKLNNLATDTKLKRGVSNNVWSRASISHRLIGFNTKQLKTSPLRKKLEDQFIFNSGPYFSSSAKWKSHFVPSLFHKLTGVPYTQLQQYRSVWNIFRKTDFGNYDVLDNIREVSQAQPVPSHIACPVYFETGEPAEGPSGPELKAEWQVDSMKESCRLARLVMNTVAENIKSGMTTDDIDILVHNKIIEYGAYPSPLNYRGFPKSVCTSVNNVACHGIPDDRKLIDGDIISVDITVFYKGYHGDCCETFIIGDVDEAGQHLVDAARKCRDEAIAICGPGVPFAAIGHKVEQVARREKVTVVPCFIGHGIGTYFHGPPDIYHCYNNYPGTMEEGMTFTVEPIVAQGQEDVLILEDGWTAVMVDNGRAAQFEHTVLITESGHEILTAV